MLWLLGLAPLGNMAGRRPELDVGLRESHVPHAVPSAVELVEANVLLLDGGVQPNRHDHEA